MRQKQEGAFQSYIHTRLQRLEEWVLIQRKSQATQMHFTKLLEKIEIKVEDYTEKVRCIDLIMKDVVQWVQKMQEGGNSWKHSQQSQYRVGRKIADHEQKMRQIENEVKKVENQLVQKNIIQISNLEQIQQKLSVVQQEIQRLNKASDSYKFNFEQIRVPTQILVTKKQLRETIQQLHTIFSTNISHLSKNIDILSNKYLLMLNEKSNCFPKKQPFDDYNLSPKNVVSENKKSRKIIRNVKSAEREHSLSLFDLTKKMPSQKILFERNKKSKQKNDKASLSSTQRKSPKGMPSRSKKKLFLRKEGTVSSIKS